MNYKELIKMVHPDLNPNVKDPGVKISQIMSNKNNPSELMRLAISWGLIKSSSNESYTKSNQGTQKESSFNWVIFSYLNKKYFKPGMKVKFQSSRGEQIAWFVKSGRGKVYFTNKKGIFTIEKTLEDLFNKFEIFRTREDDLSFSEINEWKEIVKNLKKRTTRSKKKTHEEQFSKLNLEPNKTYEDVFVYYRKKFYRLIRTDSRCAYIEIYPGEEKRVYLKSIRRM